MREAGYPGDGEIGGNLRRVRNRVEAACRKAGRNPEEVTLIAVSKKKPWEAIREARAAGAADFGENYVQELQEKQAIQESEGMDGIRWHMIGHLQKNKVRFLIGRTVLIHSVDSIALAEQVEKESAKRDAVTDILMEVNVAGEESKWGFRPENALSGAAAIAKLAHVRLRGWMTSAPYTADGESNRPFFRELRQLSEQAAEAGLLAEFDRNYPVPVLSMGMSCDYEAAVLEGATMIRVGTEIFGERG